jgi:hypothetical protein
MEEPIICRNCGRTTLTTVKEGYHPPTLPEEDEHNWSDPDPLDRAIAHATARDHCELLGAEDNDDWQWLEVRVTDHDVEGTSESVTDKLQQEGFSFVGLGSEPDSMRFNRQKSAPQV